MRLLARFHLGRIYYRLRILLSFRVLLTNPRQYLRNISWHFAKNFRDHPSNQFGLFRQYNPREPSVETFPRLRTARDHLPGIALVTPSYQQGRYLESTIQSILAQDYPKLEYAVVDGGSGDESPEIIERYRSQLTFAVSERDEGHVDAIDKGFARISGEIMAYVNSDDLLEPGALGFVGDFFSRHPNIDAIYGHRVIIDEAGKEIGRWVSPRYNLSLLRIVDYIPQETLFWRRSIYEKVGGLDRKWFFAMDWDLLLRFASAGARIVRVPYFLGQIPRAFLAEIGGSDQHRRPRGHRRPAQTRAWILPGPIRARSLLQAAQARISPLGALAAARRQTLRRFFIPQIYADYADGGLTSKTHAVTVPTFVGPWLKGPSAFRRLAQPPPQNLRPSASSADS